VGAAVATAAAAPSLIGNTTSNVDPRPGALSMLIAPR